MVWSSVIDCRQGPETSGVVGGTSSREEPDTRYGRRTGVEGVCERTSLVWDTWPSEP